MDKRYQVFVSSTFADLKEERQKVIQALMEMDCIPAGMELFPAMDEEQLSFIKRVIDDCDYYLLIIGGRYGSLSPAGISYTEQEFDYAMSKGMKIVALIHGEPNSLTLEKSEKNADLREKLEKFRAKASTDRLVKFWKSADELPGLVALSMQKTIKTYPAIGWVRGNLVPGKSAAEEMLRLRDEIDKLNAELSSAKSKNVDESLEQGTDKFKIDFKVEIFDENDQEWGYYREHEAVTWDSIFSYLSPSMIDESTEASLRVQLNSWIQEITRRRLVEEYRTSKSPRRATVESDSFNTIKIQLLALGLIQKSNKKGRSVKDSSTYWTLTEAGEERMMTLRAIKRPSVPQMAPDRRRATLSTSEAEAAPTATS